MDDDPVHWTKSINIGKPLIARLDLHRAMRRNSCLQTCLMPHSPSNSPCHSPRLEHCLHLHHGLHQAQDYSRLSPQHYYQDMYEQLQGATGGCGDSDYDNITQYEPVYASTGGLSSSPGRLSSSQGRSSIPIETTDDITELQTVFINSLQLQQQWNSCWRSFKCLLSETVLLFLSHEEYYILHLIRLVCPNNLFTDLYLISKDVKDVFKYAL